MTFSVIFTARAEKEYLDLPQKIRYQIESDINTLKHNPIPDGKRIKKLKGYEKLYRLRAGDYHIIFDWHGNVLKVIRVFKSKRF